MKKNILKKVYFPDTDDRNLEGFTVKTLSSGVLWIYIALNPNKQWHTICKALNKKDKTIFTNEYNKAFLYTQTYKEFTKLFLGKKIILKNLFLPCSAEYFPDNFIKAGILEPSIVEVYPDQKFEILTLNSLNTFYFFYLN